MPPMADFGSATESDRLFDTVLPGTRDRDRGSATAD
ncbi:hypothetical protein FB390_4670 [Nocardia bhagyanarayanae]|uniref:Uncharacterized protein n=1 Tax=Nocardia bhagyanarayanae TaxID=1215925 RepID=A0A543FGG3_9NOCA|nr:hypothetical protein FB390_4670 [Nocardia bhagyanarayanae]